MDASLQTPLSVQSEPESKSVQAFGLALLIEAFIIAGVVALMAASSSTQAQHTEPVALTLLAEEPPEQPKPQPPKPPQVKPVTREMPKVQTVPHLAQLNQITSPEAEMQSDVQTAFADPAPSPPALPPPAPSNAKFEQDYAGKVHDAVQAAYFYPPAAAAMRFSGRAVKIVIHLQAKHRAFLRDTNLTEEIRL